MTSLTSSSTLVSSTGMAIPVVGLGTWQAVSPEELEKGLETAVDAGYRHIDTAFVYMNEAMIGKALSKMIKAGKIKRKDIFVTTKLPHIAMRPELVEPYLMRSLESLGLEYVNLYLIHLPCGFVNRGESEFFPKDSEGNLEVDPTTDHLAVWKAMEAQVDAGRAKAIGISNFNLLQTKRLVENSRIRPANNQVELHIYLQQKELVDYCKSVGITVTAYAPLGAPHLPNFNALINSKVECKKILSPMTEPVIVELAEKHKKTPAQILLRFLVQSGVSVIPKSSNPERIKQNIDIFDFELTEEDIQKIRSLDKGEDGRMFSENNDFFEALKRHPEYPYGR